MQIPKVSVIIPVYKVEQYLRQCLDSVIAQTFKDIEIICVDDGSPDNCPQILEEYAAKDSRIRVIHKENGGLSSARNAALPYVTGKYILFVDSDDWIEPDLLEKTVAKAEETNADMTFFLYSCMLTTLKWYPLENALKENSFTNLDKIILLQHVTAWGKLWKSEFLIGNHIIFPEGICYEDNVVHWKALVRSSKLALVPQRFYWYRTRPDSIIGDNRHTTDIVRSFEHVKQDLQNNGYYSGEWKELFLQSKLRIIYLCYFRTLPQNKKRMKQLIQNSFGDDEREYLSQSKNLPIHVKDCYFALDGSIAATLRNMLIWNPAIRIINTIRLCKNFFDWRTN